jgi:hypothetical protein
MNTSRVRVLLYATLLFCSACDEGTGDEEWGWGDDDNDIGTSQVEMAPSFNSKDDGSVHKRRNPSIDNSTPSPPTTLYGKSPSSSKVAHKGGAGEQQHMPRLPKTVPAAPTSGGLSLQSHGSGNRGMSLTTNPMVAASSPMPSMGGGTQRITSLGAKKKTTVTPKKAAPPPAEDDIFTSMGLAAKPTFHHTSSPAASQTPAMGSRWNTTTTTATPMMMAPTVSATATDSFDAGDDNWDDDGDLDDLLDD